MDYFTFINSAGLYLPDMTRHLSGTCMEKPKFIDECKQLPNSETDDPLHTTMLYFILVSGDCTLRKAHNAQLLTHCQVLLVIKGC